MVRYLISHRNSPPIGSRIWMKVWAKRIWTLPSLVAFRWRLKVLEWRGADIGELSILSRCEINGSCKRLKIGSNSFIGRVVLHLHENVEIGNCVVINDGVTLLTASHDVSDEAFESIAKPIVIGDYAWICTDAILLPGIKVGRGAVVGAGAVVAKDVPEFAIVVGNPARILKK